MDLRVSKKMRVNELRTGMYFKWYWAFDVGSTKIIARVINKLMPSGFTEQYSLSVEIIEPDADGAYYAGQKTFLEFRAFGGKFVEVVTLEPYVDKYQHLYKTEKYRPK